MTTQEHLELAAMLHRGEYRRYLADPRPTETQNDKVQHALVLIEGPMLEHRRDANERASEQERKSYAMQLRLA